MTRLSEDSGCSICGGCDTFGFACAWVSCSWTSCRASKMPVPGSKSSTIDDSPGTDSERRTVDALRAVEEVGLERHGDELLHLLGGQPERLGLHLDVGRRELRQHVDRRVAQLQDADDHDADRNADDEQPEPQARFDDPTHGYPCVSERPRTRRLVLVLVEPMPSSPRLRDNRDTRWTGDFRCSLTRACLRFLLD